MTTFERAKGVKDLIISQPPPMPRKGEIVQVADGRWFIALTDPFWYQGQLMVKINANEPVPVEKPK